MKLIQPVRNNVWTWSATVNFIMGGMASAFYLFCFLMKTPQGETFCTLQPVLKIVAPALVSLGFFTLSIKSIRPLRARYLLRNLRSSWISREILAGTMFILSAFIDWLFPCFIFQIIAITTALGLMTSHGFAFYRARAVASWNAPLIPFLFLISSFTMGFGMVLLAAALNGLTFKLDSMVIGLTFVVLNLVTWLIYMNWYRDRAFKEATEVLHRTIPLILTVGIGHLLPSLLLLLLLIDSTGVKAQPIILVLCGLAIVTGGVGQKADIILRANYLRGIVMGQPKVSAKVVSPT